MSICAVKDCTNSFRKTKMKGLTIKYFTFPKNAEFIEAWRRVCRDGINVKYARICSKHFESWCYEKSAQQIALNYSPLRGRKLRADAIPTLYLFSEPHMAAEPTQSVDCKPKEILEAMQENIQLISSQIVLDGAEVASPKALNVKVENTDYAQQLKRTPVFNSNTKEAAASSCSINYPTTIENLQIELNKIKKAFTLFIERREKEKIMEKKERKKQMEQHTREVLSQIFTPGQIKVLMNRTKKRVVWLSEDIANAISLRCVSPKAYRYLRNVLKYPLPGLSTLRRSNEELRTSPIILKNFTTVPKLFSLLNAANVKGKIIKAREKLFVVTFDEIDLNNKIAIDKKTEQVIRPHKTCQCVKVESYEAYLSRIA